MNDDNLGNILVAEDNLITQKLLSSIITQCGYQVTVVSNGKEVLEKLKKQLFDLLILDFQMPIMNGYETLKAIKGDPEKKVNSLPVIFLTGEIDMNSLNDLQDCGASCFLRKPIQPEVLSQTISQLLKKSNLKGRRDSTSTNYLRKITHSNKELMVEIIDVFIEEAPGNLLKMKTYYLLEDWKNLKRIVHKVKANYSYLGIKEPKSLLGNLELDIDRMISPETYLAKIIELEGITRVAIASLKRKKNILLNKIQH